MARIEWVEQKLKNWALYKSKEMGGGLGFSSQSSFLNDACTADRNPEAKIPVLEAEAAVTDQAVQSLKDTRKVLHQTLLLVYLSGGGISGTAREQGTSMSTVHANLATADRVLRDWFDARPKPPIVAQMQPRVIGTLRRAK